MNREQFKHFSKRILKVVFLILFPVGCVVLCAMRDTWDERPEYVGGLEGYGTNYRTFAMLGFFFMAFPLIFLGGIIILASHIGMIAMAVHSDLKSRKRALQWAAWALFIFGAEYFFGIVRPDWGKPPGYDDGPNLFGYKQRIAARLDVAAARAWVESEEFRHAAATAVNGREFDPPESEWLAKLRVPDFHPRCELHPPVVKIHLGNGFEQTLGIFIGPETLKEYPREKYVGTLEIEPGIWVFDQGYP